MCRAGSLPTLFGADFDIGVYISMFYFPAFPVDAYALVGIENRQPKEALEVLHVIPTSSKKRRFFKLPKFKKFFVKHKLASMVAALGLILIIGSYIPSIYYTASAQGGQFWQRYVNNLDQKDLPAIKDVQDAWQPPLDSNLPMENMLLIPTIGVESQIYVSSYEDYEEILKKGVWRAPDFGTPDKREKPTILVAHRYGYLRWSNIFRRRNSFYNLPKLEKGDTVEVVWRQRKYVYAVYGESEGEKIEDYSADLILYTCRDLTSDIRIFKYAKLLRI